MYRRCVTTAWTLGRATRIALSSSAHARSNMNTAPPAWLLARAAFASKAGKGAAKDAIVRRKKSVLVDGNNVLYHFYNPLQAAGRSVLISQCCIPSGVYLTTLVIVFDHIRVMVRHQ